MQAHETEGLQKAMHEPGFTTLAPRKTKKQSWASMMVLAIVAIVGAFLLITSIRGCQGHRRSHTLAGKWKHTAEHVQHAGADAAGLPVDADKPIHVEVHRHEGKIGMVKRASVTSSATSSAASATGTVLVDYQVHQPVLTPEGATLDTGVSNGEAGDVQDSCQVVLMDYVFAYSYGEPYIGESTGLVVAIMVDVV